MPKATLQVQDTRRKQLLSFFKELSKSWTLWASSAISHPDVDRSDTRPPPAVSKIPPPKHKLHAITWEPSFQLQRNFSCSLFAGLFSIWSVCQRIWNEQEESMWWWGGGFTTDHCDPARSWLDSPCVFFEERDLFVLLYLESILREHWSSFSAPDSQTCRNKKVEVCFTVCRRLSIRQIVLSTVCGNSLLEFGCRVVSEVVYSFFTVWQLVMRLKNNYKSNTRLHIFRHHSPAPFQHSLK